STRPHSAGIDADVKTTLSARCRRAALIEAKPLGPYRASYSSSPLYYVCGERGTEEFAVPFARDLHPEFGYVGSAPKLFRKLGLVSAFVEFGLMAGASGVAVFVAGPEPDPMHAMALAPSEAFLSMSPPSAPPANAVGAEKQKTLKAGVTAPPC